MIPTILRLLALISTGLRTRTELALENLVLRSSDHLQAVLQVDPARTTPVGYLGVHRAAGCCVMSYFVSKVG